MAMKDAHNGMNGFQRILERRETELAQVMRSRDQICIERSADQIEEIQLASERDLAILNLDRDSVLLRQVRAALRRFHDGNFGTCIDCERSISPNRLAVVPWAPRCIQCQADADQDGQRSTNFVSQTLVYAA